jgi:CheY-like chemotaxis protein
VLIVDDDSSVRETFRRVLQSEGFDVVAVTGGDEALQILREDRTIGLILLDLEMPAMDGAAVRRAQLSDGAISLVPTVIVSGSRSTRSDLGDLTADGYLDKPVSRQDLLALVRQYCTPARPG